MKEFFKSQSFTPIIAALLVFSIIINIFLGGSVIKVRKQLEVANEQISSMTSKEGGDKSFDDKSQNLIRSLEEENKKLKEEKSGKSESPKGREGNVLAADTVEKFIKEYEALVSERPDYDKQKPRFQPLVTDRLLKQLFPVNAQNQMADKEMDDKGVRTSRSVENVSVFVNEDQLKGEEGKAIARVTIKTEVEGAEDRQNVSSKLVEVTLKKVNGQFKVDSFVTNFIK